MDQNQKIAELEAKVLTLEQNMREHMHNGVIGRQVPLTSISGFVKTVTVAAELTAILASTPRFLHEQVLIDTTTATKKLYIFDSVGLVWRSVTIA